MLLLLLIIVHRSLLIYVVLATNVIVIGEEVAPVAVLFGVIIAVRFIFGIVSTRNDPWGPNRTSANT